MRRRQALLGIAFLVGLLPAPALAKARSLAEAPALQQERIPSVGVALKVPAGWVEAAPTAKLTAQHVVDVYHSATATSGFLANLNVIVATVPPGVGLRQWLLGSDSEKYLSLGTLDTVKVHSAPGLVYTSSKLETFHGKPILIVEYGFLRGSRGYLFTYTSLGTSKLDAPEALFGASAATIRFVAAPLTA